MLEMVNPLNALTIDVEDYWSIFYRDWLKDEIEPTEAVVSNAEWFLKELSEHNVKATFFILGEVAEKFPSLIKKIASAGHEIAVHGNKHKQIFKLTNQQFREEISRGKKLLEDIASVKVAGHRAPAFSIMPETRWALDILVEEGFEYDSSVYPISGKRYGWPGFSKNICRVELSSGSSIIEVPLSTVTFFGMTVPAAGGGYIRHFPYIVTKLAVKHIQKIRPAIVYMHPYEVDTKARPFPTEHLRPEDNDKAAKFHRLQLRNRNTMPQKINKLLSEFEFAPIKEVIEKSVVRSYHVR